MGYELLRCHRRGIVGVAGCVGGVLDDGKNMKYDLDPCLKEVRMDDPIRFKLVR